MREAGILVLVAVASLGAIVACSSFSASNDVPDGGSADAGPAVKNLLGNSNFEKGCAGWSVNRADLTPITAPALVHTGNGSCLVCSTGAKNELFAQVTTPTPPGAEFFASVWLRKAPDAAAPPMLTTHIDVVTEPGAGLQAGPLTPTPAVDGEWKLANALVDVSTSDGGGLVLYVTGTDPGNCYLIDDAVLYRKP